MTNLSRYILLLILVFFVLSACNYSGRNADQVRVGLDFDDIKKKGELTVLTLNSSTSYFIYKEQPMGFDYDLANEFCKAYGLNLKVKLAKNTEHLVSMLQAGEGDLIAYSLPIVNELKDSLIYCGLSVVSHQVLVQQKKGKETVDDVIELIGKNVTVRPNTKYYARLENLNSELGGGIHIKTNVADSLSTEDLIEMVARGEIEYTVSDEYIAKLNQTYYRNIDIKLPISFDQRSSWAVLKGSSQLADTLDAWYAANEKERKYASIAKRYFELSKSPLIDEDNLLKKLPKGYISPYDDLFRKYAVNDICDWHLLAAISYSESRFNNGLTSWAGAQGIMGIMPRTAESIGVSADSLMNPEKSIYVASKLLGRLNQILSDIEDPNERLKFILAAYNGGVGHVSDARALAEKYGDDKNVWEGNVRVWLTRKRDPQYYNDPVCKSGYFRGTETLNYVDRVLRTTEIFKKKS